MPSLSREGSLSWEDEVKAAKVLQDNSRRWRSWVSAGHVLLISVFYENVFREGRRSSVICSIQHYSLLFTTPLTIWQGLYSSLFYAEEKWKTPAWIWSWARIVMVLSCCACLCELQTDLSVWPELCDAVNVAATLPYPYALHRAGSMEKHRRFICPLFWNLYI